MLSKTGKGVLVSVIVLLICSVWIVGSAAEPPALARLSGAEKAKLAKLIEGAKKEGEVVAYSFAFRPDVQKHMIPAFRKEYGLSESDLDVKIVSSRSGGIVTKITEELRAGVYKTDIAHNGTVGWFNDLAARGELMKYDSPQYKHASPMATTPEIAPANLPYFISGMFTVYGIAYNPKYVKGEIVHWKDVLRPEYEGKISCGDVTKSYSYTNAYLAIRKAVGADFFKELGKRKPFVLVAGSQLVNKAISGEYPIVVISSIGVAWRANRKGAGLKLVLPSEGYGMVGAPAVILAHAPHPNAAKLLIDFIHGEAGQKIILNKAGYPVGMLGIKSPDPVYPKPIYDIKGFVEMDWRKISSQDRLDAREQFRGFMKKGK